MSSPDDPETAISLSPADLVAIDRRHAYLCQEFGRLGTPQFLERSIQEWILPSDRHLPQRFLTNTLAQILDPWSWEMFRETTGVGTRKMAKLLELLERAYRELTDGRLIPEPVTTPPSDPDVVTEQVWANWCESIRAHRVDHEPLGRFAVSLSELPQGLWAVPLSEYTEQPLYVIRAIPGHGPARTSQILEIFSRIAQTIAGCPTNAPLAIRLMPLFARDAVLWAEAVLRSQTVPDVQATRENFLTPLFAQLETDLGAETTAIVRRRMGLDGPVETLEQIAKDFDLTKERIRQITLKAVDVFHIRWPEGRYILDNVYAHVQSSPGCDEQLALLQTVFEGCFAFEVTRSRSRADVLAAWDRAGRAKRTPMTEADVRVWASEEFPEQPAAVIRRWLDEEGHRNTHPGGQSLFFSHDPLDTLLRHFQTHPDPMPLGELSNFLDSDERNIKHRLERDPRFIEDEFKRVLPAERCSFFRQADRWFLRLEPLGPSDFERRAESLSLLELIHLIVGGLIQAGIGDATVWGVHRFTVGLLRKVYAATLAPAVTPFVLASTLIRHSDGIIRSMRRRRLRWDTADGSIPIRGKRGWVDYLSTLAGVPITLDELDAALKGSFQDYESYVLKQLHLDDEEEGESRYSCQLIPGVSHVVPTIVIPHGWQLDVNTSNVSEGVRVAVAKFVAMSTRSPFPKEYFRRLPWMVSLCEQTALGTMRWEERSVATDDQTPEHEPIREL